MAVHALKNRDFNFKERKVRNFGKNEKRNYQLSAIGQACLF